MKFILKLDAIANMIDYSDDVTRMILQRFDIKRIRNRDRTVSWQLDEKQLKDVKEFARKKKEIINGKS